MAKVHFFYSTMNAGKSTALLQSAHNYHETGNETILFIPREDADKNSGLIKSRIGLSATAVVINSDLKIYEYVKKELSQRRVDADIVGVIENPLNNIRTLEEVAFVMKEGKVYKR